MDIALVTRPFYESEWRVLKAIRKTKEKELNLPLKYHYILLLILIAVAAIWLMTVIDIDLIKHILGWIVVSASFSALYLPYLFIKEKYRTRALLKRLDAVMARGTVGTYVINAIRIALSEQYEDEGDLYIVEYDTDKVLYFFDIEYQLEKKGLCQHFEIYEDDFAVLINRNIYHHTERIAPVHIDSGSKWKYLREKGGPGHLQTETANFDQLVAEYNSYR